MLVSEIMSKKVVSVDPQSTVSEASKLISKHNIGSVPVAQGGNVCGILTDRDIVLRCVAEGRDPKSIKVADVMTSPLVSVSSKETIETAMQTMANEQVRRMPVVDAGKLVGFVSMADFARIRGNPEISDTISEISMPR